LEEYGFDVFMYVSVAERNETEKGDGSGKTRDKVRYPIIGDNTTCEPLRPQNQSNRLFCSVAREPHLVAAFPETYKNYWYGDSPKFSTQLLHQLRDQLLCLHQVEAQGGIAKYSHMIRLRPDLQIRRPLPPMYTLDFGQPHQRKILCGGLNWCCCGNEDIFSVSTYDVMRTYTSRYNTLQSLPAEIALSTTGYYNGKWTAETFLKGELARVEKASFVFDRRIAACTVRPISRKNSGDP
jgi:hypothetical protein